jgi:dTDP-4-amino-4,6-dideoxygalactose transaminase
VSVAPADRSLVVSWLASGTNGGSAISYYMVTDSQGHYCVGTPERLTCTLLNVTNNVSDVVTVTAINDDGLIPTAEIIREKGTDRSRFLKGAVDKYTWQSMGSSFLPGELIAAFLHAQLEQANTITLERKRIWNLYYNALATYERRGALRRPIVPAGCQHNAHMFFILVENELVRYELLERFRSAGIGAIFHYIPLHASEAGRKFGRIGSSMQVTEDLPYRIVRLPLYPALTDDKIAYICETIKEFYRNN